MPNELKNIQDDVELMNKTFVMGSGFDDSDNKTEPPTTDESDSDNKTEPPTTDEPAGETDEPRTDAPETEPFNTEAPDDKDQIILDLRTKLSEKDTDQKPTTKTPTTKAPLTFEDQDFLKDLNVEDLSDKPEKLNSILNSVYQKAITEAQKITGNEISQSVPNMVTVVANLQKSADDFYDANADLKPFKKVVATVFDELIVSNPNKPYSDVMLDVAPEVRKRLELPKLVSKKVDKGNPPKLPSKKRKPGKSNSKPKTNLIEDGINEMNKTLWR